MKLWAYLKSLLWPPPSELGEATTDNFAGRIFSSNTAFAQRKASSPGTLHAQWIVRTDGTAPQAEAACPPGALVPGQDQPAPG